MNSSIKPPRLAEKLFQWYCGKTSIEDLHGDLEEYFYDDLKTSSSFVAKIRYWKRVLSLIFSVAIRHRKQQASFHFFSYEWNPGILKNYFKTASRNLAKNKFFTVLNVFGLALGMSISLLFVAMLTFIYRYDDFHPQGDRIYRVITHVSDNDENPSYASAPAALTTKLEGLTGIDKIISIQNSLYGEAQYGERKFHVSGCFTQPAFFTVFNFPFIKGNPGSALANPNSIVITEREATNIFGNKDPMGEVITMAPFGDFVVTGILKDFPKNSHMHFDVIASYATLVSHSGPLQNEDGWTHFTNSYIYLLVPEKAEISTIENYLNKIAKEKYAHTKDFRAAFALQNLHDIVPGPKLDNGIGPSWDYVSFFLLGGTMLIILIPACANYVNLSISQSLRRMKEVGVRKVMGGQKKQIFFQFVTESILTMLLALVLSYFFFGLIKDEFMEMSLDPDTMELNPTIPTVINFIVFAVFVGFAAGIVPALYFAKITPVSALKGKPSITAGTNRFSIGKVVITVQFILSLGFIMAVVIMLQQYRYSVNYNFGFEQNNILDVELQSVDPQIFRNEFEKLSTVESISMSSHILGLEYNSSRYIRTSPGSDSIETAAMSIDEKFISNLKLEFLAGRDFSSNAAENKSFIIINEELVKKLKLGDPISVIDKSIILPDGRDARIRGVLKNFHYASLRTPISSFFFEYNPDQFQYANLSFSSTAVFSDLTNMEATWKTIGGDEKFKAQFFSDEIREAYSFYFFIIKIWGFLGLLAITVTCLGLLGTVAFTIRNRVKEVSIRKVMGASSKGLVYLLSKDFLLLMLIASVITIPVTVFIFNNLLMTVQHYNVTIGFIEIAVSLILMLALGLLTIFSQTMKAANANPVDNLRTE